MNKKEQDEDDTIAWILLISSIVCNVLFLLEPL
jgi:hypothetical protein